MRRLSRLDECVEVHREILRDTGDPRQAMQMALRLYAATTAGHVVRRPLRLVIECVCQRFDVPMADLLGEGGSRRVLLARRIGMYVYRPAAESWQECARAFGRQNHTDAVRRCRQVEGNENELALAAEIAAMVDKRISEERGTALVALHGERGAA